jgi:anti-anti-sigma regulatory factor
VNVPSIFAVQQTGERTVVRFNDWLSSFGAFYGVTADAVASEARDQLEELIDEHGCTILAIDLSPVRRLPSSLLGVFIALSKGGLQIELLHPSQVVCEALEVTKLGRFLTIRDYPSP